MNTNRPMEIIPTPTAPGPATRRLPEAPTPVVETPMEEAAVGRVGDDEAIGVYAPLPELAWNAPRPRRPASSERPAMTYHPTFAAPSIPRVA